ncbi:MAG: type II toxin-antitoxin system HicB family antitoxin [Spirochaetae bacterium HGW-Spirochaetae-7]|jgi:antitoxin HicB|nr:MAG: type II toxin-antitoxin system HicB family antitoxin [Spirochaetae bacterium HGW-Spirochaetae-7]
MRIAYPAVIAYDQADKVHNVDFPDLPGCITFGKTRDEALLMASDALSLYLESIMDRKLVLPKPSTRAGTVLIEPRPGVAFALWLRARRKDSGMTLTEAADKLGVKYQVYQKLENPGTSNPTLKTLKKLEKVFGMELVAI